MIKHKIFKLVITAIVVFLSFSTIAQGLTYQQIAGQGQVLGASTPAFVQVVKSTAAAATVTQAFSTNVTAGNVLVAATQWGDKTHTISSVSATCTTGNWTTLSNFISGNTATEVISSATVTASGLCTVSVTLSGAPSFEANWFEEISGVQTPVDVSATGQNTFGTTVSTASVTTNGADYLFGFLGTNFCTPTTWTLGSGWTNRFASSNAQGTVVDMVQAGAGSVVLSGTASSSCTLSAALVAFQPAASGVSTNPPVISNIASSGITASAATLTWTTDINSDSQVDYGTTTSYGSSSVLNSTLTISHSVSLSGLTASTLYHYRVKSSSNGNLAVSADNTFTTTATPPPPDTTAPTVPSGLTATAISSSQINLSWTASTDVDNASNQISYTIYRGGVQIGTTAAGTTSYSDSGLTASTNYFYTVDAFDVAGNHSSQSTSANATTQAGSGCPSFSPVDQFVTMNGQAVGTAVTTANLTAATEGASHSWSGASAHQTFGASQVTLPASVTVNGGTTHSCGFATQSLAQDDGFNQTSGGFSTFTPLANQKTVAISGWIANLPPKKTTNGALWDMIRVDSGGSSTVLLQFEDGPSQACNTYSFAIERSNGGTFHSSCITNIVPGGTYFFSGLVDWSGSGNASLNLYTVSGTTFTLIGSTGNFNIGIAGIISQILIGNAEAGSAAGVTTYFQNLMFDYTNHVFPNVPSGGTGADTQAPTQPTNLSAAAVSSSQINLSWTASLDNIAVTGYTIYRGGVQIGTSATNSYSDTGLSPSTSYTYTVDAFDAAGNHSAQSTSASATTQAQSTGTNCSAAGIRCVGPGRTYSTIQACATAMQPGDTCVVFAGTYNENVNVPASTAGTYKTIQANASDVVTVQSFTMGSHTKLIGNCPTAPSAINTCGFNIQNPSAPSSAACVGINNGSTDIYIMNNVMYACGSGRMVGHSSNQNTSSYIFIQNNTMSYACVTQAQASAGTPKECDGIIMGGNHWVVENNDMSHYTLGMYFNGLSYGVIRNNTIHDEYETEAGGNAHTDAFFAEPQVGTTSHNLIEGNHQYNGVGLDAKGLLIQGNSCTTGCNIPNGVVFRYNTTYDLDGRSDENDCATSSTPVPCSTNVKYYNNTYSNIARQLATAHGDSNDTSRYNSTNVGALNNIYYFDFAISAGNFTNPVGFDATTQPSGVWGHDLGYCNVTGASNCPLKGMIVGQGLWTDGPGNIYGRLDTVPTNNPNFVNLAGKDFHLQSTSPAIGVGTSLTNATGSGSNSTSLAVGDVNYFQDGYGLTGVQPDCIKIGSAAPSASNTACIASGGINYSTNTITLVSPVSWNNGDPIYLYKKSDGGIVLTSANPDMGAYPYTGTQQPPPPDTVPPTIPTGVTASAISTSAIAVSWTASTDNVAVSGYNVYRNGTLIGTSAGTAYNDTALLAGTTYSYTVSAFDAAGNTSAQSAAASATTQSSPDTTAPTVTILNPSSGSSLTGTVTVSVNASDPTVSGQTTSGLSLVTISIDGTVFATSTSGTLSKSLDTTTLTNASHTITAIAKDNAGNQSTQASVSITVNNASATKFPRLVTLTSLEGLSAIPAGTTITATVLSPSSGSTLETQSNLTASAGNYTVSFLSSDPQLVDIRITVNGYLSAKLTSIDTTVNSSVALSVPQLLAGDLNSDNTINSLDYSLMNSHFLQNFSQADINRDGLVNSLDYAILKNNYGKSGQ